jgi:hypothetical protein
VETFVGEVIFLTIIKSLKVKMHEEKYFSDSRGYQDTRDFQMS